MTTTAHADLEALHRHLDEHPDDQRVRRDLADHLEEWGDPAGEALRWLADNGKWPVRLARRTWTLEPRTGGGAAATDAEQHCPAASPISPV
jgi:hypothetical protein